MSKVKFKIHWSFFVLGLAMMLFGHINMFICCILCVILHEMGHSIAGRKLGYNLDLITLTPYGAMLTGVENPFSENDEIKIAVAGPIVNALLIILSIILWRIFPSIYIISRMFVQVNLFTLIFNLLPVYPLDGGRVVNALLSKRKGKARAKKITNYISVFIIVIFFIMFFISFFFELNYMLGINALFLLIEFFSTNNVSSYYERVSELEYFKPHGRKVLKIDKEVPIFVAYKKMIDSNASKVLVVDKNITLAEVSRNKILKDIISNPIDTKLKLLINYKT